jgi:hypothetical protein
MVLMYIKSCGYHQPSMLIKELAVSGLLKHLGTLGLL